jgi:hypothetical protein
MKRLTVGSPINLEILARQQGARPARNREDLYRHSVRDDENLDEWLTALQLLRHDRRAGASRKP